MKKILLVCSSGGHLLQLYSLKDAVWNQYECTWVTFNKSDARSLLSKERKYWGYFPTNRNIKNLLRNAILAFKIFNREKPNCVVSTGAGIAVPFLLIAKIYGAVPVYIESFARKQKLSLSGKMVYFFVQRFIVQSKKLSIDYRRAVYKGTIY